MLKSLVNFVAGALVAAGISSAFALVGNPPQPNGQEALINQTWVLGLAGGQNFSYQSGITAHAGGTQASCLVLTAGNLLQQVSTVATSADSVCLPYALQGEMMIVANAAASNTLDIYAQSGTNGATNSTDTINAASNTSAYTLSANNNAICFAPKNGIWNCIKGS